MKKDFDIKEIKEIAKEILLLANKKQKTSKATIIALSGDLGAGKTTLTQTIAKLLGVKESVISPTFILIKNYQIKNPKFKTLVHIDAYRFDHENELTKLGWESLISNPDNLILIEWPERVQKIIPKGSITISLSHKDEKTRHIHVN